MVVLARAQFEVSIFNGLFIWQVVRKRKEKREEVELEEEIRREKTIWQFLIADRSWLFPFHCFWSHWVAG